MNERARRNLEKIRKFCFQHQKSLIAAGLALIFCICATIWIFVSQLPGPEALRSLGDMSQATTLYDIHNKPVFTLFKEYRIEVPLEQVSPNLRKAILAIEDQRFTEHGGIDVVRIAAAAWADLRAGRKAQGGSTITQQLARQMFLDRKKTLGRKIREVLLAFRIERMYSKDEILSLYLNKVYFGDGLHGAEAAARGYFGKSASDLSLSEGALLAGLVNSPSNNAPTVNLQRAVARRNVVLKAMLDEGAITQQAFDRASHEIVELRDTLRREEPLGQYFKEEVRQQLVKQFGWDRIGEGGLRVYTTIDPDMQRAAETAIADSIKQIEARRAARAGKGTPKPEDAQPLQAALVALDPASGEVRALVGGRDFDDSKFDRATQAKRQPGSAFKPFVYAAALEAGYTPSSLIDHLDQPIDTFQGAWIPEDEHSTAPAMTMRTALRTSSNRAAVRMLQNIGISKAVEYAKRLGVGDVPSVPSLALGSGEVTLLSMTSAYAAFDSAGVVRAPIMIKKVEDDKGRVLYEAHIESHQAIAPSTAFLMSAMLSDVVNYGTAYKARQEGFTLPAAGKTGTTNDFNDAWFVGFTPRIVAGVWLGFDKPHTILRNGFAGDLAVPMWAHFMKAATAGDAPQWLTPPPNITAVSVCRTTGMLADEYCDRAITEYFVRGTQPTQAAPPSIDAEVFASSTPGPAQSSASVAAAIVQSPPAASAAPSQVPPSPDAVEAKQDEPKKKRGFWGRLFKGSEKNSDKENSEK